MIEETFWNMIERSGSPVGTSFQDKTTTLGKLLGELEADELLSFVSIFEPQLRRAYSWELWAVAYIAFLGCSDDDFEEFRAWLISNGKAPFERCLIEMDFAPITDVWSELAETLECDPRLRLRTNSRK
jgi:hypothetical protein